MTEYMRERRRREAGLGSATWIDAKGRLEQTGPWFDAPNHGFDYRHGRARSAGHREPHPARWWILLLLAVAVLVTFHGAAKREAWFPDPEPGQPFPPSGSVTVARSLSPHRVTSSLEIQAGGANAVLQLFDRETRRHVLSVYVAGADRVRVPAPQGAFEMRLVEGRIWYGAARYFGPDTSYHRVLQPVMFGKGVGQIIDLRRRADGNLLTRSIMTRPERL